MEHQNRVRWWEGRTGSDIIGDLTSLGWIFGEREYGDVRWRDLPATGQLIRKANSLLHELRESEARKHISPLSSRAPRFAGSNSKGAPARSVLAERKTCRRQPVMSG